MILEIGIGIIMLGIGLFIGKAMNSDNYTLSENDGYLKQWVASLKEKLDQRRNEKRLRSEIIKQARMQALKEMGPEMINHIKEQERKKLTGEDKKEKLEKFANMFGGGGSNNGGFNTSDKLNNMLGNKQPQYNQPPQQPQYNQPPQQPQYNRPPQYNQPKRPVGRPRKQKQKQQQQYQQSPQQVQQETTMGFNRQQQSFDDKMSMILGNTNDKDKKDNKQSETDRILSFLN